MKISQYCVVALLLCGVVGLGGCANQRNEAPTLATTAPTMRARAMQAPATIALANLAQVQAFGNRVAFRSDVQLWGRPDYWATPQEFFRYGGDCEDYAIAKRAILRAGGWPEERLRVLLVEDLARGRSHAVLEVDDGAHRWLLDNQTPGLLDAATQTRYLPQARVLADGAVEPIE